MVGCIIVAVLGLFYFGMLFSYNWITKEDR